MLLAALIYWVTLAVAVISVAALFLLVRGTFGLLPVGYRIRPPRG